MTVDEALKYADDYLVFKEKYYDAEHVGMTYSLAAEVRRLRDEKQYRTIEQVGALSSHAYCEYINQMKRSECLGYEHKMKKGTFGKPELDAHNKAHEWLGKHRAFADVLAIMRGEQ